MIVNSYLVGCARDPNMRLGAGVGRGCAELDDRMMVGLRTGIETPAKRGAAMRNFPEKIASALMESIMAAFRTEAADLEWLSEEVDVAGQDVVKIRDAIERYTNRRTKAIETIRTRLTAEVAEFKRELGIG